MQTSTYVNHKYYHKVPNNAIQILKVDDIVKVNNTMLIVTDHSKNTYTGQDLNGNKINFFIDDVEKLIFDSSSQMTVQEAINKSKLDTLKESLADIEQKLKSTFTSLSSIKNLKTLRINLIEQIKELEPKDKYIQMNLF